MPERIMSRSMLAEISARKIGSPVMPIWKEEGSDCWVFHWVMKVWSWLSQAPEQRGQGLIKFEL